MDCGSSLNKSGSSSGLKTSAPRNVALKRKVSLMRKIKIVFVKHQYGIAGVIVALSVIAGMWITLTTPQKNPSQVYKL